ncbi:MAG: hypothetical protein WCP28_09960 [Actinomycetes bacterium]
MTKLTAIGFKPDSGERVPADLLLRPAVVLAIIVLALNDYVFKSMWPGLVTGKLSDVAGLFAFPIILVSLAEVARRLLRRTNWAITYWDICWACVTTGIVFTLVKTLPWASQSYAYLIGTLRWPVMAVHELFVGGSTPGIVPIDVVTDPTDLVALLAIVASGAYMSRFVHSRETEPRESPGTALEST